MTLRQIAKRNVWQNRQRYAAYVASAAFSVMIYFMYSALINHPDLQSGYPYAAGAVKGMKAAAVVIAVFTFLFLLYSNGAFVRSRKKEFGMLNLLGLTRRQLVGMILWESLAVGGIALLTGLAVGLLFLKLFFMAISALLQLPTALPFYVGTPVWIQTLAVFGSFFLVVSLLSLTSVLRSSVIQLLRADRKPKATPTFSLWKALLGLTLVVGGYVWASAPDINVIAVGVIPVTAMVTVGTFFLMREGSTALLQRLRRNQRFFYRTGPFLSVSQLTFKMQDNYRVLSAVAITLAVILTAIGTIAGFSYVVTESVTDQLPNAYQLVRMTPASQNEWESELARIDDVLHKHGIKTKPRSQLITYRTTYAEAGGQSVNVTLIPYSFYSNLRGEKALPLSGDHEAIRTYPFTVIGSEDQFPPTDITLQPGDASLSLRMANDLQGPLLNPLNQTTGVQVMTGLVTEALVVSDSVFQQVMEQAPSEQHLAIAVWQTNHWKGKAADQSVKELRAFYGEDAAFSSTLEIYQMMISALGFTLFVGFFVTLVFFAASCSILYFRLFTEKEEDRRYFQRLQELGASRGDLRRASLQQTMVIFFVPFLVGVIHSTFAMKALGTILEKTVLHVGWLVALGYLVLYGIFFAITYAAYWRSLSVREDIRERTA